MAVIDDAIALEKRAEENYRNAEKKTSDPGAKKVLGLLADEEAGHAQVLAGKKLSANLKSGPNLLEAAKRWVRGAVEGGTPAISTDASLPNLLRRAMEIERTTEAFYREHGREADDPRIAELFDELAQIEQQHFLFIGSLLEYYDRPNEWVESAEFGLRSEY